MERLVARLDIYMFKNQGLESSSVVVNSIEFVNQILNTNSSPEVTSMPTPISKKNVSEVFLGGTTLQLMPSDLSEIVPENAHASFYTYRNIAPDATPDANTPYIRIKALFNGISYTYRGYLTDQGQTTHKYSLLHNTVYRVMAMLDHPDNQLIIKRLPIHGSLPRLKSDKRSRRTTISFNRTMEMTPVPLQASCNFPT